MKSRKSRSKQTKRLWLARYLPTAGLMLTYLVAVTAFWPRPTASTSDIPHPMVEIQLPFSQPAPAGGLAGFHPTDVTVPILFYHYPPPNFEAQLDHLEQTGYTVVSMDEVVGGLRGQALPDKPVAITFDDGFAPQTEAAEILKRHHMKATFYIITGGERSLWCIGAGRRYGDPVQPVGGCGDDYMNWDQIRALDRTGLFTIGAHTVNHVNLAALTTADQKGEILSSKEQLEEKLGHPVRHFAYPYGSYGSDTVQIVREAGFLSAVTTDPGIFQAAGSAYTLHRVRDAMSLP